MPRIVPAVKLPQVTVLAPGGVHAGGLDLQSGFYLPVGHLLRVSHIEELLNVQVFDLLVYPRLLPFFLLGPAPGRPLAPRLELAVEGLYVV